MGLRCCYQMVGAFVAVILCELVDAKSTSSRALFRLQEIPDKGVGVIATRKIEVGELLLDEKPLFTVAPSWFQPSESYSLARVDKLVEKLTEQQKNEFFSLHGYARRDTTTQTVDNAQPDDQDDKKESDKLTALDIFRTNAYPTLPGKPGLFPLISRFNSYSHRPAYILTISHCTPNVHYHWDEARQKATIYSVRDIEEGEEIVNCYISPFLPRYERQAYFVKNFGFQCTCKACSLTGDDLEASDNRRSNLAQLEGMTRSALQSKSKHMVKSLVALRMRLLDEEGLASPVTLLRCKVDEYLAFTGRSQDTAPLGSGTNSNVYVGEPSTTGTTMADVSDSNNSVIGENADPSKAVDTCSDGEFSLLTAVDVEDAKELLSSAITYATLCKGPECVITKWCADQLSAIRLL